MMIEIKKISNFYNGKSIVASETGLFPIYGSNGVIGYSSTYLYENAIILGRVGANCGSVFYEVGRFFPSDNTIVVKAKNEDVIEEFLYYSLSVLPLNQLAGGSAQPLINQKIVGNLKIKLPNLSNQKKIVGFISNYEKLIEINKKRIQLLENMTEELYKEWFVRFRFPNCENTFFEKGLPISWERLPLKTLCEEIKNSIKKQDLSEANKYVGLEHLSRKDIAIYEYSTADTVESNKLKFQKLDILFSKIRPYLHKVCLAHFDGVCSTDTIVLRAKNPLYLPYILFTVFNETFIDLADVSSNGTKMPRANWHFLQKVVLSIPPIELMEQFYKICMPILQQIEVLLNQIEILRQQKDSLLPRLISGKVPVEDLDIQFPPSMLDQ